MTTTVPFNLETTDFKVSDAHRKIYEHGVLYSVTCSGTTFKVANSASELGRTSGDIPEGMYLGNRLWMPTEVVNKRNTIFGRARRAVEDSSFAFPISGTHFVPRTRIVEVDRKLEECQEALRLWCLDMSERYTDYLNQMRQEIQDKQLDQKFRGYMSTMEAVWSKMGVRESAASTISVSRFKMALPKEFEDTETLAELIFAEQVKEKEESLRLSMEECRRQAELQIQQQARQQAATVQQFLESTQQALCQSFLDGFSLIRSKIDTGQKLTATNAKRMKDLISNFRSMDFLNMEVIDKALVEVEQVIDSTDKLEGNVLGQLNNALRGAIDVAKTQVDYITTQRASDNRRVINF